MKKIYLTFLLLLSVLLFPLYGYYNGDVSLLYLDGGDLYSQYGFGLSLGMNLKSNVRAVGNTHVSIIRKAQSNENEEYTNDYGHIAGLLGLEYFIAVPYITKIRIQWKVMALAGYSMSAVKEDYENISTGEGLLVKYSDNGFTYAFRTGLQWDWKQNFSPFIELGWHGSQYHNKLKDANIRGMEFFTGMRFSLPNVRDINQDY